MELRAGDHIAVRRRLGYRHHGIFVGGGRVVHFDGEPLAKRHARICEVPIEDFAAGGRVARVASPVVGGPREVAARARSRVGERGYGLVRWNCEHFAHWCRSGRPKSGHVRTVASTLVALVGVLVVRRDR